MVEKDPIRAAGSTDIAQLRAENMAYATQSTFVNLGANLFEPLIGSWWQRRHTDNRGKPGFGKSYGINFGGELAGDIGGGGTLFLASAVAPQMTQGFISFTGRLLHPVFFSVAHVVFRDEFNEPDYMAKVQKWARFQERSFARSLIVTAGGIAANVSTQKYILKSQSPTGVIFAGKLLSTSITNSLMLLVRLTMPQKMKDLDISMGRRYLNKDEIAPVSHVDRVQSNIKETVEPSR